MSRTLSLTEELEKLEQSITLTLQEIDHNFSRAHRIVTSSILPIVEQYAQQSRDVWEGSKFWKQFFESSANVSLSGYEEQAATDEPTDETFTDGSNATTHTTLSASDSHDDADAQHISITKAGEEVDLSSITMSPSQRTPRHAAQGKAANPALITAFADYPSPYEALRQEINAKSTGTKASTKSGPKTPGKSSALANRSVDIAMTPDSSPFLPKDPMSLPRPSTARKKTDPLLHHVLDKNYRIQATPLGGNRHTNFRGFRTTNANATTTPATTASKALFEPSMSSSPVTPAAPQLHAEIFSSPVRKPRTPGVSVLTPGKPPRSTTKAFTDSDDDDFENDHDGGFPFDRSPPKTMQFHVPQSRLLKTPAKEASKRIVEDLLLTAGVDGGDDFTDEVDYRTSDDNSPSVIRRAENLEDESF